MNKTNINLSLSIRFCPALNYNYWSVISLL